MTDINNSENRTGLLDNLDPGITKRLLSRRGIFRKASLSLGAAASAPVILAAASRSAFGQALPQEIVDVLNFALTLEYLEDTFYRSGYDAGIYPAEYRPVFNHIGLHEAQHVAFLSGALGSAAVAKPEFDFTAGGQYPDALSNFATFATLSQTFEDLGVAAYKGQAANLMANGDILTAALQIHSVEARHAAEVRRINGVAPWSDGGAFDEPLSKEEVLAAATPFIRA